MGLAEGRHTGINTNIIVGQNIIVSFWHAQWYRKCHHSGVSFSTVVCQ